MLELAEGNIGGVWIARSDVSQEQKKQMNEVNTRWLGAQHDDFQALLANCGHRTEIIRVS